MERAMKLHGSRWIAGGTTLLLAATLAACGADSKGDGETVLTGLVVVPETGCAGCDSSSRLVTVLALVEDGAPQTIKCVRTSERGVYDSADPDLCPEQSTTTFQAAADGNQTVIVIGEVGTASGPQSQAQIGGVLSAPIGLTKSKDFNGTTQIACVASVYLTAGNSDASAGCVVQPSCPSPTVGGVPCFQTVPPESIGDDVIENLEEASAFVSDQISYPSGVPGAVCAVLECTQAGAQAGTAECVQRETPR
jgi:hypothetical protein